MIFSLQISNTMLLNVGDKVQNRKVDSIINAFHLKEKKSSKASAKEKHGSWPFERKFEIPPRIDEDAQSLLAGNHGFPFPLMKMMIIPFKSGKIWSKPKPFSVILRQMMV